MRGADGVAADGVEEGGEVRVAEVRLDVARAQPALGEQRRPLRRARGVPHELPQAERHGGAGGGGAGAGVGAGGRVRAEVEGGAEGEAVDAPRGHGLAQAVDPGVALALGVGGEEEDARLCGVALDPIEGVLAVFARDIALCGALRRRAKKSNLVT